MKKYSQGTISNSLLPNMGYIMWNTITHTVMIPAAKSIYFSRFLIRILPYVLLQDNLFQIFDLVPNSYLLPIHSMT